MPDAMQQLNEAESRFFESAGQDVAPSLIEDPVGTRETSADEGGDGASAPALAEKEAVKVEGPEKDIREAKFVPLEALQEERAEKKQLREELK
jgi:hypothetical protein